MTKINIQLWDDDIPHLTALKIVTHFISEGAKGLSVYKSDIGDLYVTKKPYRKNDCYVVYKDMEECNE